MTLFPEPKEDEPLPLEIRVTVLESQIKQLYHQLQMVEDKQKEQEQYRDYAQF